MTPEGEKNWFIHDSIGILCHIENAANNFIKNSDLSKIDRIISLVEEHLFMNNLYYDGKMEEDSLAALLEIYSRYKDYPKIKLVIKEDFKIDKLSSKRYLFGIIGEMRRNAYKAGAKITTITVTGRVILVENDGKPIENPSKIFEEGYSEFGTTGKGLTIVQDLANWIPAEVSLHSTNPVIFKINLTTRINNK